MGSKYTIPDKTRWELENDIQFSDHAHQRYEERTPTDAPEPEQAWERGEDILHPELLDLERLPGCSGNRSPERVRVYRDASVQIAFVLNDSVVASIYDFDSIPHGPTRSYFYSYGPHGGDSA